MFIKRKDVGMRRVANLMRSINRADTTNFDSFQYNMKSISVAAYAIKNTSTSWRLVLLVLYYSTFGVGVAAAATLQECWRFGFC